MIFCVEDDPNIREIELYTLQSTGFPAKGFPDAEAFFEALKTETPDLVLMDVMLPGQDGVEALRQMKRNASTAAIPVIMATARGTEYDKVHSLDLGADDYLVKPFGMMEMVSRIKAVLRRCGALSGPQLLTAGELVLNLEAHTVAVSGAPISLTFKEFELLRLFLTEPGKVFTRDQLLSRIWGISYDGETRTVDVHIRTLRQKLGPCGSRIATVRNVGYRWEA